MRQCGAVWQCRGAVAMGHGAHVRDNVPMSGPMQSQQSRKRDDMEEVDSPVDA
jgi:hypothetical protein